MHVTHSRLAAIVAAALLLGSCGSSPDDRKTDGEAALTAKAVADVDGAIADARGAAPKPLPAATK